MRDEKLAELAEEFRWLLEAAAPISNKWGLSLSSGFPAACCDDSSMLLAAFLADNGYPDARRVLGVRGGQNEELSKHVWLQVGEDLVDITADQFDGYDLAPVICTTSTPFHKSFKLDSAGELADFRIRFSLNRMWLSRFQRAYEEILGLRRRKTAGAHGEVGDARVHGV